MMNVGASVKNQMSSCKDGYMQKPSACDCECYKARKIDQAKNV